MVDPTYQNPTFRHSRYGRPNVSTLQVWQTQRIKPQRFDTPGMADPTYQDQTFRHSRYGRPNVSRPNVSTLQVWQTQRIKTQRFDTPGMVDPTYQAPTFRHSRYGRYLEAWHINVSNHALNRDEGAYFPDEYMHLIGR
jgi:hypothetical protein